jgi:hypothetical protein
LDIWVLGPFPFWVFAIEDFASLSVYLKPIVASFEGKRKRKRTRLFSVLFLAHFGFEGVDILRGRFFFFSFFPRDFVGLGCVLVLVGNIEYLLD